MAPDPYVKIYRALEIDRKVIEAAKGSERAEKEKAIKEKKPPLEDDNVEEGGEGMPTRCPVYTSNYVRSTREASWSTAPIPIQLFSNSNNDAMLTVEVWDMQFQAEDRQIGTYDLTAKQMLTNEHGE